MNKTVLAAGVALLALGGAAGLGPSHGSAVRGGARLAPPRRGGLLAMAAAGSQGERSREDLRVGIAGFYDRSSAVWERTWGEHMHHGYYEVGKPLPKTLAEHQAAQVDMIDRVLDWATVDDPSFQPFDVVDVGCGIGGSSRHIARRFGSKCTGITLSPYQRDRAEAISQEQGLGGKLAFKVADALDMPFADDSFGLTWSLESGEHMPDKPTFVNELVRVTAPGGRVIVVTWCHRDLEPGETGLKKWEEKLLTRINKAYYLPRWCSVAQYEGWMAEAGLQQIRRDDWTAEISAFWPAVVRSALRPKAFWGMLRSGRTTVRGALAMFLMIRGYRKGLIVFGLITGTKPADSGEAPTANDTASATPATPPPVNDGGDFAI